MSAFVRAFVFCDDCGQPMDNSTVPSARTISEALRDAKRSGWVRKRGRRDLCQGCTPDRATEEPTPCGKTTAVDGTTYPPCARHAGHSTAYCRDASGNSYFLAAPDHATEEPK